ncbi:MAG: patatin-like phospholipase RssA [Pseudomonadales bacterium]
MTPKLKIGLALGSGSARGMAHIGVIRAMEQLGVKPDIICGSSVGSLIGAAYTIGKMDELGSWISELSTGDILRYMDIRLAAGGGFAHGQKLMDHLRETMGEHQIESLPLQFAAVATDLHSGREIWLKEGSIWDAVRASIALPGILTPVAYRHHWLVDGGLVNPVPVSVCRAMGADIIIAVNLNGDLVGRHTVAQKSVHENTVSPLQSPSESSEDTETPEQAEANFLSQLSNSIKDKTQPLLDQWRKPSDTLPGIFDVIAGSINIMQDRITRSRLAGEPADILISPRLAHIGLLEFERANDAIEEGGNAVRRQIDQLRELITE